MRDFATPGYRRSSYGYVRQYDPGTGLAVAYVTNEVRDGFEHAARTGLVAHVVRELFG